MKFDVTFVATVEAADEREARFFVGHLLERGEHLKSLSETWTKPTTTFPQGLPTPKPKMLSYGGVKAEVVS